MNAMNYIEVGTRLHSVLAHKQLILGAFKFLTVGYPSCFTSEIDFNPDEEYTTCS